MSAAKLFGEIIGLYSKHGWELKRALLRKETSEELGEGAEEIFGQAQRSESEIDALWFARASHAAREAWELRLVGDPPYALFETFEQDEAEDEREEVRREMEARLREYARTRAQSS